jgi:putative MATE family efflux protein
MADVATTRRLVSSRGGALDREIARLAIPAFTALVSEPAFLLADAAIVGHLGTAQLAGLGLAGMVVQTAVGMCVFLAYGTTAAVARAVGGGEPRAAARLGIDGVWLALLIGLVATALIAATAAPLLDAFGPSPAVRGYAVTYLRIAAFGVPSLLVVLAATGVIRGLQDTRTPLVVTVGANIVNIGLNLALVYAAGLGIAGSALGTVLAQTAGATALTAVVVRHARNVDASLRPDASGVRQSAKAGVPLIVRTVCLRVALLLMTYVAAGIGTVAVAAHQVAFTVWTFLAFALDAIAIADQAITGRLLGARDGEGAKAATRRMIRWGVVAGLVAATGLLASRSVVPGLFTSDPDVQRAASAALLVAALHQPVAGVVFVLDGVLIGAGDGRYLAWASLWTLLVFAPLALLVRGFGSSLTLLWWAFTGYMLARLVTLVARERTGRWAVVGVRRQPVR